MDDFMCDCQKDGKERCEMVLNEVYRDLKTNAENLLTDIVYDLSPMNVKGDVEYSANIGSITSDMWAGISAEVMKWDAEQEQFVLHKRILVQCDKLEYGMARLWQLAYESVK